MHFDPAIAAQDGLGAFRITGTYVCNEPLRVRSLYIDGGTLEMTDNCQLYVDSTGATPPR